MIPNQPTKSSAIWQPMFLGSELSDENLYDHQGEYHRYLNTETVLTIILDENHFYVENNNHLLLVEQKLIFIQFFS